MELEDELDEKAFQKVLDRWMWWGKIDEEAYHKLSPLQRKVLKVYELSISRLKYAQRRANGDLEEAPTDVGTQESPD